MRYSLTLAALATALAVAGCNRAPLQAPQQVSCNCPATPSSGEQLQRFAPPPVRHSAHSYPSYREHHDDSDSGYGHAWSSSEMSVSSYSYRSHSQVYDLDDDDTGESGAHARVYARAYAGTGAYAYDSSAGDAAHYETGEHWQDSYGRDHNRAHLGAKALRKRLDPWHGYNRDWDNGY